SARGRAARRCDRRPRRDPRVADAADDAERGNGAQRRAGHPGPAEGARSAAAAFLLALPQAAPRTLRPLPVLRRSAVRLIEGARSMGFPGTGTIWMNGKLVEWKDATIHVASHVIHYGSGVFEGARCYATPKGSACFRLDAHMRRLQMSAKI